MIDGYALTATIMESLEYPMLVTTISEQDSEQSFKPVWKVGLPKAGFERNLIGTIHIVRDKILGLSVMHPSYNHNP
jgi:hypothetical protein